MIATGNVEIAATGRVSGNIKTDSLVISKGGCFRGNVAKINEEPAATLLPLYLIEEKFAEQLGPREQPGACQAPGAGSPTAVVVGSAEGPMAAGVGRAEALAAPGFRSEAILP